MPATTPGYGLPYPVGTDPVNPALDIQRLAENVDGRVAALYDFVGPEPAVRLNYAYGNVHIQGQKSVIATNAFADFYVYFAEPFSTIYSFFCWDQYYAFPGWVVKVVEFNASYAGCRAYWASDGSLLPNAQLAIAWWANGLRGPSVPPP